MRAVCSSPNTRKMDCGPKEAVATYTPANRKHCYWLTMCKGNLYGKGVFEIKGGFLLVVTYLYLCFWSRGGGVLLDHNSKLCKYMLCQFTYSDSSGAAVSDSQ